MKDLGRMRGGADWAVPLKKCDDAVYIITNVEQVTTDDPEREEYEFDCIQYTWDEYNSMRMDDIELAMAEIYEGGLQ